MSAVLEQPAAAGAAVQHAGAPAAEPEGEILEIVDDACTVIGRVSVGPPAHCRCLSKAACTLRGRAAALRCTHVKHTTQQELRGEIHRRGLLHRAVYVWVFDDQRRLLLQRRSWDKKIGPGQWDLSAAEHLSPGECAGAAACCRCCVPPVCLPALWRSWLKLLYTFEIAGGSFHQAADRGLEEELGMCTALCSPLQDTKPVTTVACRRVFPPGC